MKTWSVFRKTLLEFRRDPLVLALTLVFAPLFVLLYWLIQRMQVTRTMLIPLLSTVIAVILDAIVLGERLHWRTLGGGGAILTGLAIALTWPGTWSRPPRTHRVGSEPGTHS